MKNLLNVEITRPDQVLILMRGISGSGKSTKAKELVDEGKIFSADEELLVFGDYFQVFKEMKETGNMSRLSKAHNACLSKSVKAMKDEVSPVIIDNMNLKPADCKPYVVNALKLGFSEENIIIEDLGTNGLTAQQLADRNTHGVDIEIINRLIQRHKSGSPMTIKKILEAKDAPESDVLYTAVVLDQCTRTSLQFMYEEEIPEGWTVFLHHMTIRLGESKDKSDIGNRVPLTITHVGKSDMAMALKVTGYKTKNEIPHITVAVNPNGGKPVMSNDITSWRPVKEMLISGIVTEVKKFKDE